MSSYGQPPEGTELYKTFEVGGDTSSVFEKALLAVQGRYSNGDAEAGLAAFQKMILDYSGTDYDFGAMVSDVGAFSCDDNGGLQDELDAFLDSPKAYARDLREKADLPIAPPVEHMGERARRVLKSHGSSVSKCAAVCVLTAFLHSSAALSPVEGNDAGHQPLTGALDGDHAPDLGQP